MVSVAFACFAVGPLWGASTDVQVFVKAMAVIVLATPVVLAQGSGRRDAIKGYLVGIPIAVPLTFLFCQEDADRLGAAISTPLIFAAVGALYSWLAPDLSRIPSGAANTTAQVLRVLLILPVYGFGLFLTFWFLLWE